MTARVSILLKSRASLTCFRASFLPGRAKDLSALRYVFLSFLYLRFLHLKIIFGCKVSFGTYTNQRVKFLQMNCNQIFITRNIYIFYRFQVYLYISVEEDACEYEHGINEFTLSVKGR